MQHYHDIYTLAEKYDWLPDQFQTHNHIINEEYLLLFCERIGIFYTEFLHGYAEQVLARGNEISLYTIIDLFLGYSYFKQEK